MVQPIQRRLHVVHFTASAVMLALAEASPAKIETQHGKTEAVQRLHGMKDDFIVQSAAIDGMRMTNDAAVSGTGRPGIEQGFEPACGAFQKKGSDCAGLRLHSGSVKHSSESKFLGILRVPAIVCSLFEPRRN